MANVMIKEGDLINRVIYEHACDTFADLENIPAEQISLGSTAIVLRDPAGLRIFMADSNSDWIELK